MSKPITAPKIDPRVARDLLRHLRDMVPHYTPEWSAKDEDDPGIGLLKIFADIVEGVINRLNRAPDSNFVAFLNMLGIRLLPETPSHVPVRFLMTSGSEEPFLIESGTQVSASATRDRPELPFETEEPLWAIPSTLSALIAVDPETDHISKPPPGFLVLEVAASNLPPYSIQTFSSAGSNTFQLDRVDQLQKGDFLRIELPASSELPVPSSGTVVREGAPRVVDHHVIADIKGQLVTVADALPRDYDEGTAVKKEATFELFEAKNFQEHILYVAHSEYFNVKSDARFELALNQAPAASANLQPLKISWEFWGVTASSKDAAWQLFDVESDGSVGLSRDGRISLRKSAGEIKETEINGNKSRWIRARLTDPIPAPPPPLPHLESVMLRVSSTGSLPADQAFNNDTPLVIDQPFMPFGFEPRTFDRFYLASAEAFSKPGAAVEIEVDLAFLKDPDTTPNLSWEYWNGSGWVSLSVRDRPRGRGIANLSQAGSGSIQFKVPDDIAKTEVAGQDNYWIRARIVGGDYGRESFTSETEPPLENADGEIDVQKVTLTISKDGIRPPQITKLRISYEVTNDQVADFVLTLNNLDYLDQTAANRTPDKDFPPFTPLPDPAQSVYFGFDSSFQSGPVRLYFATKELRVDERDKPKLAWAFWAESDWKELTVDDDTNAFTQSDVVSLNVPRGFHEKQQFGASLYWIRATLVEGSWSESPLFFGVFVNTCRAIQARTVNNEILGSGTSSPSEHFRFQQLPVLEGAEVRVREVFTEEERQQVISAEGQETVLDIKDQQGRVLETWVRWKEVPEFFDSGQTKRHYRLDRATGEVQFGDGVHGRILPAGGDNVRAFTYRAGGGANGNVAAGEINALVTAVAGVDSVINPVPAGGGSARATLEQMLVIGPAQVSHRDRAVTPNDFEWLAKEASRQVRKARCVPNRNRSGRGEAGWVSVYIVPDSSDAQPQPSLALRRAVTRFLSERADTNVVDQEHIFVGPPAYVPVSVDVSIFARSLDDVAAAEIETRRKLDQFLHPLSGGPEGEGWDFGRDLAVSDLYSLLEDIPEVDHVGRLTLRFDQQESSERVEVGPNALVASGEHAIRTMVANGK